MQDHLEDDECRRDNRPRDAVGERVRHVSVSVIGISAANISKFP